MKIKRIASLFLVLTIFTSLFSSVCTTAAAVSGNEIANYAQQFVGKLKYVYGGTSLQSGADCSGFIYAVHKKYGITINSRTSIRKSSSCANIGTNINKAKPGMIIVVNNNSHVVLYIGNNKVVHLPGKGQYCKISDIKYFKISGIYKVNGVSYDGSTTIPENKASKPSISVTNYPTTLNQGSSYGLRGSISANGATTSVSTAVVNSSGKTVLSTSDTVSASATGNIKSMNVNNKINFSKLSAGSYTLKITAKNSAGSATWSKAFTVKGKSSSSSTKKEPSSLAVNLTSYPTSITKGKSYGLRGSVTSNYNITSVKGYIINSKGQTVQSSTDTPNAKSMDIRYSNVNNKLIFNKLSKGTYTLKVVAYDAYGASKTWQRSFMVK